MNSSVLKHFVPYHLVQVDLNNHEMIHGLLKVPRLQKQLMPICHRISDRGLEVAYVWLRKENFVNQ